MTDELKEEIEVQDADAPEAVSDSEASVDNAPLSREVVSKIVERERRKAFEKGQREALMQMQQEQQAAPSEASAQAPAAAPSIGGMQQVTQADIERMIAERAPQLLQEQLQQQVQQQQMKSLVESFASKMQAAEAKYPGLEAKLNDLDYTNLGAVVHMANELDNTGDIMHELVDNPEKLGTLILLSHTQPMLARKKLADLSSSIKVNEQAKAEEAEARDPMSQLKPSRSAGMDSGTMSVSDFRKMFR